MSKYSSTLKLLYLVILSAFAIVQVTMASDPDILIDYKLREWVNPDRKFFTFTGFHVLVGQNPSPSTFKVSKASMVEFPALNGQSVSYAVLQFPGGNVNPPHTHPRSSEVGFVDTTTNKLCTQSLQIGDVLVFPSGLAHFQHNVDAKNPALAISAFGSANAGTVSLPNTFFNTSIDDTVLALAFKTDVATIRNLKKGLAS
ncbi:germin-like protein 9-3 [Glycine max]|uniref:germin-like protein 9-3 n=1 Tax=Glycine max TaxID=3847 RepID=UPI0003DED019|nr:germin-like protein 9-3 [Glycine max]|eukprot:XP_025980440.1 germin-like protein 9-3 [Glycine max]